jgi:hypothetical protein
LQSALTSLSYSFGLPEYAVYITSDRTGNAMPSISGKALISETTEKVLARSLVVSSAAILTKMYDVPFQDLKALGMELPASLVDTVLLILVVYYAYSLTINWLGDLAAFRLWFRDSSIWSDFGSNMKLDKDFIRGVTPLLVRLHEMEKQGSWPVDYSKISDKDKEDLADFKTNANLYTLRLDCAGTRFSALSWFGQYYVWFQSYAFPMLLSLFAIYLLVRYGSFSPPPRV